MPSSLKYINGIIQAVLDQESVAKLTPYLFHPVVYCHHITLAYDPSVDLPWMELVGKPFTAFATRILLDKNCQAAEVALAVPCNNTFPHVTLSAIQGIAPKYSNRLGADPKAYVFGLRPPIQLSGMIEYSPFAKR